MPKHDFLTPKAIANRIKSKGLQKLRWYCQMCQKQCRDENGYKCHIMSESHQRQLLLVAENPGRFVGGFSSEFLRGFMDILRRQYGTRRVLANSVYQEYIKDKDHYHMNATRWSTLSGFCMFLGKNGLVEAEPTPKGWYITYIDRSPETLAREAADAKKKKMDRDDAERTQKMVEDQIVRALDAKKIKGEEVDSTMDDDTKYTGLERREDETITLKLFDKQQASSSSSSDETGISVPSIVKPDMPPPSTAAPTFGQLSATPLEDGDSTNALKLAEKEAKSKSLKKREDRKRKNPVSSVEEIFKMEDAKREKRNRKDFWLHEDIIVKVLHDKLGDKYYKRKGVVEEVRDTYTAIVRMLDNDDRIKIDQAHLETVIPALSKQLLVVNGAFRGCKATLEALDMKNYCVSVKICQGPARGRIVDKLPYEDVSKLNTE